ncbi:hypothetical protein HDK90DRAFT_350279 [Phyllosticta capitalensis]|uniref:Uncharacterized protein n=1 Tax=Phyllosticta capitalensis TaxID=121624 RepID=A0ABR1YHG3_9PEZI
MQSSTFLMNQFRLTATTTAAQAVLVTTSASLAVTAMTRARPSTATVHDDAVDAMNALGRIFNEQRVTLRNDNSDQKFKGLPANIYQGSVRSEANHLVSIFPPPQRRARPGVWHQQVEVQCAVPGLHQQCQSSTGKAQVGSALFTFERRSTTGQAASFCGRHESLYRSLYWTRLPLRSEGPHWRWTR